MIPEQLRALGVARYGQDWQSPLARAIGMSPRHMRRLAAGSSAITDRIEADIQRALGGVQGADAPDWPRDVWIVGDAESGREYVIRVLRPRFVARVVALDETGAPDPSEQPADVLTGITCSGIGYVLAEIVWIDPPPPHAEIEHLLAEACDAVDRSGD